MAHIIIVAHIDSQHSRQLAHRIREGVELTGNLCTIVDVDKMNYDILRSSNAIIFGCPTIMGSASAAFKAFMEDAYDMFNNQVFKNKFAAGFTYGSHYSGDKFNTIQELCNFAAMHSMPWISQGNIRENEAINANVPINSLNSYLGNMSQHINGIYGQEFMETAYYFGRRIGNTVNNIA